MRARPASKIAAALALAGAALVTAGQGAPSAAAHAVPRAPQAGKIKHVIVIFQENRSFDEVLGYWCLHPARRCDGYVGNVRLRDGSVVPMAQSPDVVAQDPPHTIKTQVDAVDGGKMDGWGHLGDGCNSPGHNNCLTYYKPSQIPALTSLADQYVVSDRTFTGQNSPSWGGHIWIAAPTQDGFTGDIPYYISGPGWGCDAKANADWISPSGIASREPSCIPAPAGTLNPAQYPYRGAYAPTKVPYVPSIFDRLEAMHLPWRIYETVYIWSVCPNFATCIFTQQQRNMVPTGQILTDAKNGNLPAYSIVLPEGPGHGTGQHPPSSMLKGDNWIGQLVNALQASKQWSSTAIFITYDDCGCFYDHVPPGINPDGTVQGIRVPMVIVSPYAKRGFTDSKTATFGSILRFTENAFGIAPLGVNDAKAYDFANSFNFNAPGTAPRVWPHQQPIPESTQRLLAALPPDDANDPT